MVLSQGTLGFQNSAEVYNCTHTEEQDYPPYTGLGSKGCLMFSNLSLIQPECSMKGLIDAWLMSQTFPINVTPC
jgi:hypothetical protein